MTTDRKGTKILTKSFYSQLRENGASDKQVLDIAAELIDLVTSELRIREVNKGAEVELRQTA